MSKVTTAFILGVTAILSGILNYLTYPILIHHLSIADYAEFSTYMSLSAILSIPASGFAYYMLVVFRRSFLEVQAQKSAYQKKLWLYTMVYMMGVTLLALIAFFVLKLTSPAALMLIIVSMLPGLFAAFAVGLFQALEWFLFLGLMGLVSALLRFGLSFLVLIESSVWMGLIPFVFPGILISAFYIWRGKKELQNHHAQLSHPPKTASQHQSVWGYVMIMGVIILLQNMDILLVKMLFSDYDVTLYASVAVIVKFALIFIGILETIFSPTLVDLHKKSHHRESFLILGTLSLIGYLVAVTFLPWAGNTVLHILKGELTGSWMLWASLGTAMVSLGFFSLFAKVYLSWGGKIFTTLALVSVLFFSTIFAPNLEIFASIFSIILFLFYVITLYKVTMYE